MSKRKERRNLPKASVDRARDEVDSSTSRALRRAARREERSASSSSFDKPTITQRNREGSGGSSSEMLRQALAKPTKFVSEEQLHQEYGYVLSDLRNMFILAGGLFVLLIVLAQFI